MEITGDESTFENKVTTLTGKEINLESYGFQEFLWTHVFWMIVGLAWVAYWFRKLPVLMPRYKKVIELEEKANAELITMQDMAVSFFLFCFHPRYDYWRLFLGAKTNTQLPRHYKPAPLIYLC